MSWMKRLWSCLFLTVSLLYGVLFLLMHASLRRQGPPALTATSHLSDFPITRNGPVDKASGHYGTSVQRPVHISHQIDQTRGPIRKSAKRVPWFPESLDKEEVAAAGLGRRTRHIPELDSWRENATATATMTIVTTATTTATLGRIRQLEDANQVLMRKLHDATWRLNQASKAKPQTPMALSSLWAKTFRFSHSLSLVKLKTGRLLSKSIFSDEGQRLTRQQHRYASVASKVVPFIQLTQDFYVYAAYLDQRQPDRNQVRILALFPDTETVGTDGERAALSWQALCHFQRLAAGNSYNSKSRNQMKHRIDSVEAKELWSAFHANVKVPAKKYIMCENHGKKYGGWILSCSPPRGTSHSSILVSLALTNFEGKTTETRRVYLPLQRIMGTESLQNKLKSKEGDEKKTTHEFTLSKTQDGEVGKREAKVTIPNSLKWEQSEPEEFHLNTSPLARAPVNTAQNQGENKSGYNEEDGDVNQGKTRKVKVLKNIAGNGDKISDRKIAEKGNVIGVCVPPLYGDIDVTRIVNFVEMCRLFGAQRVFLYINDIPNEMRQFVLEYADFDHGSFLRLVEWQPPVTTDANVVDKHDPALFDIPASTSNSPLPASELLWNRGQLLAVQHCLYTNMDDFDWLLFLDVDEMLFPGSATNGTDAAYSWARLFQNVILTDTWTLKHHHAHSKLNNTAPRATAALETDIKPRENASFIPSSLPSQVPYFQGSHRDKYRKNKTDTVLSSYSKSRRQDENETKKYVPQTTNEVPVAAIVFHSAVFRTDPESLAQHETDYFQRLSRPAQTDGKRTKMAVKPAAVFEMGIHHLSRLLPTTTTGSYDGAVPRTVLAHPTMALVHHFREGPAMEQDDYFHGQDQGLVRDEMALQYEGVLTKASKAVLNYLGKVMLERKKRGLA